MTVSIVLAIVLSAAHSTGFALKFVVARVSMRAKPHGVSS